MARSHAGPPAVFQSASDEPTTCQFTLVARVGCSAAWCEDAHISTGDAEKWRAQEVSPIRAHVPARSSCAARGVVAPEREGELQRPPAGGQERGGCGVRQGLLPASAVRAPEHKREPQAQLHEERGVAVAWEGADEDDSVARTGGRPDEREQGTRLPWSACECGMRAVSRSTSNASMEVATSTADGSGHKLT